MRKWFSLSVVFCLFLIMAGCSGGGGGSAAPTAITLTGAVTFPPTSGTPKVAANMVADSGITITVYDLAGNVVATDIHPQYDDALAAGARTYSYSVPNLKPGADYVIKAQKGAQVIRKLLEKEKTGTVTVSEVNLNAVSTTALVVAEQKLKAALNLTDIKLGETSLPTGVTSSTISSQIAVVKPSVLESTIGNLSTALVNGNLASITSANVDLANALLIVNAAVAQGIDPRDFITGAAGTTSIDVDYIEITGGVATKQTVTCSSTEAGTIMTSAATSYAVDSSSAPFYVGLAQSALADRDIANANSYYEQALAVDPNNKEANFGGAITKGIMLVENPDVKTIVSDWGATAPTVNQVVTAVSPVGNPFTNISSVTGTVTNNGLAKQTSKTAALSTAKVALDAFTALKGKLPQQVAGKSSSKVAALAPTTAPSVSEMQTVIDNVILPALKTISARLAKVEGNGYSFTVTKTMQGNADGQDVVLSDGEFYTLDAAVNAISTLLKIATAYNLDVAGDDYNAIKLDPLATLNNPSFFTLKAGGQTKMADALALLKTARDKAEAAYNVLAARAPGAGAIDIASWSTTKKANFAAFLDNAKAVLAGPAPVVIHGKSVKIDVSKFFTNPLDRTDAPTLGYDVPRNATLSTKYGKAVAAETSVPYSYWNGSTYVVTSQIRPVECNIVPTSDLPDYTLNGILPENTAANNVANFNGILPVLGGAVLTGAVSDYYYGVTTDGTSIFAGTVQYTGTSSEVSVTQINPNTGVVTRVAGFNSNGIPVQGPLFPYNGVMYCLSNYWNGTASVYGVYPVTTNSDPWVIDTTPVWTTTVNNSWVSGIYSTGTELYYSENQWDPMTYANTVKVHKVVNLPNPTDTVLFTTGDYIERVIYSNNYLYTTGDGGLVKRSLDGTIVASYEGGMGGDLMLIGGYFYTLDGYAGKVVKHAGTPAKGTAKSLASAVLGINF